jgi:adenosine deaminase CECR1
MSVLVFVCALTASGSNETLEEFLRKRAALVSQESSLALGSSLVLSAKEQAADSVLRALRDVEELAALKLNGSAYAVSEHFFIERRRIEASAVFRAIRTMPKGAVLHLHSDSMVDVDWLVAAATYSPDCHACVGADGLVKAFRAFTGPTPAAEGCEWLAVPTLRSRASSAEAFDRQLYVMRDAFRLGPCDRFLSPWLTTTSEGRTDAGARK